MQVYALMQSKRESADALSQVISKIPTNLGVRKGHPRKGDVRRCVSGMRGGTPRVPEIRTIGALPMPRALTIGNVGQAFKVVKAMPADGLAFGDDHRPLARAALAAILEERWRWRSSAI